MDLELLWDVGTAPTTQDRTMASMAHEGYGSGHILFHYLTSNHTMPNRFHAVDWANYNPYAEDLDTDVWLPMWHHHDQTLAHIDY